MGRAASKLAALERAGALDVLDPDDVTGEEAAMLAVCYRKAASRAQYESTRFAEGTNVAALAAELERRGLLEKKETPASSPGGLKGYYVTTLRGFAALEAYRAKLP